MSGGRVLLISANTETVPTSVYPLALARLASAVSAAGYRVRQHDLLVHGWEGLTSVLEEFRPDVVGISLRNIDNTDSGGATTYVDSYRALVRLVRAAGSARVVLGGGGYSLLPERLLELLEADFGIVGPGERPLCRLLDALSGDGDLSNIPGLLSRGPGGEISARLDQSPVPNAPPSAGCLHDEALVRHYWREGGMIGVQTKLGCNRRCVYCTYPLIDGRDPTWADPDAVADEMARLRHDHDVSYFFVVDSVFNLARDREVALAEAIIRRDIDASWGAFFTPDGIDQEYLRVLARSGLTHVEFGTDSLCDPVLRSLRKGFAVQDVMDAADACDRLGLHVAHYLVLGGPGETADTIRCTLDNAARIKPCVFFPFAGLRIYRGTALHRIAVREGAVSGDDDCLDPRFYFAPGLDADTIWRLVKDRTDTGRPWILPSFFPKLRALTARLRQRGVRGPLWDRLTA